LPRRGSSLDLGAPMGQTPARCAGRRRFADVPCVTRRRPRPLARCGWLDDSAACAAVSGEIGAQTEPIAALGGTSSRTRATSRGNGATRCSSTRKPRTQRPAVRSLSPRQANRAHAVEPTSPSEASAFMLGGGVLQLKHHVMFAQQPWLRSPGRCDKTRCAAVENLRTAVDERCKVPAS